MGQGIQLRTWIEIDKNAALHNIGMFRGLIPKTTKLIAVVKSNAYGHGILDFPKAVQHMVDWFGVDSITEGLRLRKEGIRKPILVLGATLKSRLKDAARHDIAITVSNFETLRKVSKARPAPKFHIKLDTGMHRQGFQPEEVFKLLAEIKNKKPKTKDHFTGIYTHFAKAKARRLDPYTKEQLKKFEDAAGLFHRAGSKNVIRHAAATAGTFLYPEACLDMVRIGIGFYGLWPSQHVRAARSDIRFQPVLSWRTVVVEVKDIARGECVGYDLTGCVRRPSKIAVLPIGYWHGFDRGLSNNGFVLIRGRRVSVLGRVSMDMTVVDATNVPAVRVGDVVTLIGQDGKERISADEIARALGTINYEVVTRINPLIYRGIRI